MTLWWCWWYSLQWTIQYNIEQALNLTEYNKTTICGRMGLLVNYDDEIILSCVSYWCRTCSCYELPYATCQSCIAAEYRMDVWVCVCFSIANTEIFLRLWMCIISFCNVKYLPSLVRLDWQLSQCIQSQVWWWFIHHSVAHTYIIM